MKSKHEILARAEQVRDNPDSTHEEFQQIDSDLRSVLGSMDPFWILWEYRHVEARKRAAKYIIGEIGFQSALNVAKVSFAFHCAVILHGEPQDQEGLAKMIGYLRSGERPFAPDMEIFDLLRSGAEL